MGGGLMQLVAYGAQDIYLTGNPQITFFKVVYRRHTNFSMEAIEQTWNGSSTADGRCTATISRNGDLVHRMYIELTAATTWDEANPGAYFMNSVELEIGGQRIDKHFGHFLETWAELTQPNPNGIVANGRGGAGENIRTNFQRMTGMGGVEDTTLSGAMGRLHVPLQFWFCRNPGLALPLIALQYHEVKVILDHQLTTASSGAATNQLWVDYIYLDTDERRRFAQQSHEYLIEQVQHQAVTGTTMELNFNHPVKELIWTGAFTSNGGARAKAVVDTGNWKLKLNGHDRMADRDRSYYTRVQVHDHHSGAGGLGQTASSCGDDVSFNGTNDSIAVYSFALKPEEHQPSGTCNFSRIDNAQLTSTGAGAGHEVYAINYNVLRIMSGMGGLAYSN
jgi:hypothetical protein